MKRVTLFSRDCKVRSLRAFSCCSMWLYRAIADIDHGHISVAAMKVEPK